MYLRSVKGARSLSLNGSLVRLCRVRNGCVLGRVEGYKLSHARRASRRSIMIRRFSYLSPFAIYTSTFGCVKGLILVTSAFRSLLRPFFLLHFLLELWGLRSINFFVYRGILRSPIARSGYVRGSLVALTGALSRCFWLVRVSFLYLSCIDLRRATSRSRATVGCSQATVCRYQLLEFVVSVSLSCDGPLGRWVVSSIQ